MNDYRGFRAAGTEPGKEHRNSDPQVQAVLAEGIERQLAVPVAPDDYPFTLGTDFEWGYIGSGGLNLAGAILADVLGFLPSGHVVLDFSDSVIAELPRLEFELRPDVIHAWLDVRLTQGAIAVRDSTETYD